jgi:hypothetical protein
MGAMSMPAAKASICACMALASAAQLEVQQLWDSSLRRTTKRERPGLSRSILARAAA